VLPLTLKLRALSTGRRGDPAHDVRHAEGFVVRGPDGRIGTVLRVHVDADFDLPTALAVRTGLLLHRVVLVRCDDVVHVDPDKRLVAVRASPS